MKGSFIKKFSVAVVALCIAMAAFTPMAFADSSKIVTLGADITSDQRAQVLKFFGLSESDLSKVQVITVNNTQEHQYLDGIVPNSVIGTRTISCAYIEPTTSGGINVETANLTYVTKNTLYNALQTAGIENCNLVVTAPYEVSGTGALTGVFVAYESTGKTLDTEKKEAATEELIDSADLEQTYGEDVAKVISDVKDQVASSASDMTDDQIRSAIKSIAEKYGITLSDDDINKILEIAKKIQELDYDSAAFSNTLSDISSQLNSLNQKADGVLGAITNFFDSIANWFSSLFGGSTATNMANQAQGILNDLDTSVFQLDK